MASVRDELIDELVGGYDCDKESATKAVDRYIQDDEAKWDHNTNDPDAVLEHIYSTQKYWE